MARDARFQPPVCYIGDGRESWSAMVVMSERPGCITDGKLKTEDSKLSYVEGDGSIRAAG